MSPPLMNVPPAQPPAHHHALPQPHRGVAVTRLGEVRNLDTGLSSTK